MKLSAVVYALGLVSVLSMFGYSDVGIVKPWVYVSVSDSHCKYLFMTDDGHNLETENILKAGLSEAIIVAAINKRATEYDKARALADVAKAQADMDKRLPWTVTTGVAKP